MSLNLCQFIGNLGRDPEVRSTQSGDKVANLSLAVTEKWKDKTGERQERTEWVRVTAWGKLAEICEQYLRKGSKVYVSGNMQSRKYTDNSGVEKISTEIVLGYRGNLVMLSSKPEGGQVGQRTVDGTERSGHEDRGLDDDIPF